MASYQRERDEFFARMTREGLSPDAIRSLLRQATSIQRYAELACSSEAADRDRIPCPGLKDPARCLCDNPNTGHSSIPRIALLDYFAERRARRAVPDGWRVITEGDPRGYTLRVIPPSYAERNAGRDRFNLDSIGVPARPSNLRF